MTTNNTQKVALITGSTSGIGLATAMHFLDNGWLVCINSRHSMTPDSLLSVYKSSQFFHVSADVTVESEAVRLINETVNHFGRIDTVICNVGNGKSVQPGEETPQEWVTSFNHNFFSTVNIVCHSKLELIKTKGTIVCISSICGHEYIEGAPVTYSVAKSAINNLVNMMSRPLARSGVRINGVSPGNILFPGSTWDTKLKSDSIAVSNMLKSAVPLNRFGLPSEIASLVYYLASDSSKFITGSVFVCDGGQLH